MAPYLTDSYGSYSLCLGLSAGWVRVVVCWTDDGCGFGESILSGVRQPLLSGSRSYQEVWCTAIAIAIIAAAAVRQPARPKVIAKGLATAVQDPPPLRAQQGVPAAALEKREKHEKQARQSQ